MKRKFLGRDSEKFIEKSVKDGSHKSIYGLTEDPNNIPTITVSFLHVNSGNTYRMSCGSECVTRDPRSTFPTPVASATFILVSKNSCERVTSVLADPRS
jgi:hypothetical protein